MISNSGTSTLGLYDFKRQIDAFGGVDYFRQNLAGGYLKNARVMLTNGDIVKSTIDGNVNDPNSDMTGWDFTATKMLGSIASMLSIPNPLSGTQVVVTSFNQADYALAKPTSLGGGLFKYDVSKSTVNDGVVIFNGWVRQCDPHHIKASWCGLDGSDQDAQEYLKVLERYILSLPSNAEKSLEFDGSFYKLKSVRFINIGDGVNIAFNMTSNLHIKGMGKHKTIIQLPDNVMSLFGNSATTVNSRIYSVFGNFFTNGAKNTSIKDLCIDFNVNASNYYTTEGQDNPNNTLARLVYGIWYTGDFGSENVEIERVQFKDSWSHNSIVFGGANGAIRHKNVLIKDCWFNGAGDGVFADPTINKVTDHSSIYICGDQLSVKSCKFTNNLGSVVSAGVEMHNFGEISDCDFHNFTIPCYAVSMENIGCNVVIQNNTIYNAIYGFAFSCRDANSKVVIKNNYCLLSSTKARFGSNNLTYVHSAIESDKGVNLADYTSDHDTAVVVVNNVFEQSETTGWDGSDNYINACMSIKECKTLVVKGNTFKNFKGAALRILRQNGVKLRVATNYLLESNTYIDCALVTAGAFNEYNAAYIIEGEVGNYAGIGSLTVRGDTFINCGYGSILCSPTASIASLAVDISVKVVERYINPYFCKGTQTDTYSKYIIKADYNVDAVDPQFRNDIINLSCDLYFASAAYGVNGKTHRYVKPMLSGYRCYTLGFGAPTNSDVVAYTAPNIGDKFERLNLYYGSPSKFFYVNKSGTPQWVGGEIIA